MKLIIGVSLLLCVLAICGLTSIACNSSSAPDNGIVPSPPLGLSWTTNSTSAVVLFWEEVTSSPADGFHVYRKTATTSWGVIGSTTGKVRTYIDTTARRGTYLYKVSAYNGAGESGGSQTIQVNTTLFLNAPTALTIAELSPQSVHLTWNDNSLNEAGFLLARWAVSFGDSLTIDTLPPNTTTFTDSKVVCGKYYQYEVLAFDSTYRSAPTKTVDVSVPFMGLSSQLIETSQPLSSVFALGNSLAYIAGAHGAVLKTTDGATWTPLQTGNSHDLSALWFTNDSNGFVVGASGTILHTTDGGISWKAVNSGKTIVLNSICFSSPDSGWIVGANGTILFSSNGGGTWVSRVSGTNRPLNCVRFFDPLHGLAVGTYSTILATTDGGSSWHAQSLPAGVIASLYSVSYDTIGVANVFGLNGQLYHTSDGGTDWQIYFFGNTENLVTSATFGYYDAIGMGSDGVIIYTMNGGLSWQRLPYTSMEEFVGVSFAPDGSGGYVVGASGTIIPLTVCSGK